MCLWKKNKILVVLLGFSLYSHPILSQQSVIKGIVSLHNSQFETGIRKYISMAWVIDVDGTSQGVLTDSKGFFSLHILKKNNGEKVELSVTKKGYEVVNFKALNAVAGQKELLEITMAKPNYIADFRKKIYQVGKTTGEREMDNLIKSLKKQLAEAKLNSNEGARVRELESRLIEAESWRLNLDSISLDLASTYSRINLDTLSSGFKRAFEYFLHGHLDSVFSLIDSMNLPLKVNYVKRSQSIIDSASREIESLLRLKINALKLRLDIDAIDSVYKQLFELYPNRSQERMEYARFLLVFNLYERSKVLYNECLNLPLTESNRSIVYSNLGSIYYRTGDLIKGERYFKLASESGDDVIRINNLDYINSKVLLGRLYSDKLGKLPESEALLKTAIGLLRADNSIAKTTRIRSLALAINALAITEDKMGKTDTAAYLFEEGLVHFKLLTPMDIEQTKHYISLIGDHVVFLSRHKRLEYANRQLREEKILVNKNFNLYPNIFRDKLLHYFLHVSVYSKYSNNLDTLKEAVLNAERLYEIIEDSNSFKGAMADAFFDLGFLFNSQRRVDSSKVYLNKSLRLFESLKGESDYVLKQIGHLYLQFAEFYFVEEDYKMSLINLQKAESIFLALQTTRFKNNELLELIIKEKEILLNLVR